MAGARHGRLAIALYLIFSAAQWMSAPGLYNLVMNETPDRERSTAAAMTLFCNALAGSAATAGAGILFTRFGYPPVLLGIAGIAAAVAILFWLLIPRRQVMLHCCRRRSLRVFETRRIDEMKQITAALLSGSSRVPRMPQTCSQGGSSCCAIARRMKMYRRTRWSRWSRLRCWVAMWWRLICGGPWTERSC